MAFSPAARKTVTAAILANIYYTCMYNRHLIHILVCMQQQTYSYINVVCFSISIRKVAHAHSNSQCSHICVLFRAPSLAWLLHTICTIYTHRDEKYTLFHVCHHYLPNTGPSLNTGTANSVCNLYETDNSSNMYHSEGQASHGSDLPKVTRENSQSLW